MRLQPRLCKYNSRSFQAEYDVCVIHTLKIIKQIGFIKRNVNYKHYKGTYSGFFRAL
ncbi:hypothetical protein WN51_02577 [Melipona quadrifasciata]|uniref:Uncharacterized protein n=1 Tax=Melipona quadrifasciata TaxID=166423 RepID=A0A0N0U3R8_9HYME|nr:hypothetical protein WN51_02577 [Melipona quadrifasciata]